MADVEIAIQRFQEAIDATSADHPDRAKWLNSLGIGYQDRYQRTGAKADLEKAIERYQEAVDATPADDPDRAGRLHSLGSGYQDRYQRTGAITDLEIASGHVTVIGLGFVCIDLDLMLKSDQALRRTTFFNILASRISQRM